MLKIDSTLSKDELLRRATALKSYLFYIVVIAAFAIALVLVIGFINSRQSSKIINDRDATINLNNQVIEAIKQKSLSIQNEKILLVKEIQALHDLNSNRDETIDSLKRNRYENPDRFRTLSDDELVGSFSGWKPN